MNTNTIFNGWNAVVHLPATYAANPTTYYPCIYFIPGLGEIGTNVVLAKRYGPNAYIEQGWDGKINGRDYIVISIQPPTAYPRPWDIKARMDIAESTYRINTTKTVMTGLSMGGWASCIFATYKATPTDTTYLTRVKCIVNVQGVKAEDTYGATSPYPQRFADYANAGGKMLAFEQVLDGRDIATTVNTMNAAVSGSAVYQQTSFGNSGHCCFNNFYGGGGTVPSTFPVIGTMYNYIDNKLFSTPVNQLPVVSAGVDITATLPTTVTLNGTATDADGTIVSTIWTQVSGPASTISSPSSLTTNVIPSVAGVYQYRLTATDNQGGIGSDDVTVTINSGVNILHVITLFDNGTYIMS